LQQKSKKTDVVGLIGFGIFLVLLGWTFISTPGLIESIKAFIIDFKLVEISPNFFIPAPQNNHPILYGAVYNFCILFGIAQIILLIIRFALNDTSKGKGENIGGIFFWFSAAYLVGLLSFGSLVWNAFVGSIVVIIGASIIINVFATYALKKAWRKI